MVKVTNIPPPPQDIYTRRVSVEMSEAEWLILKHTANYYAELADVEPGLAARLELGHGDVADAINRAGFNSDGFYSLDFSKCFVSDVPVLNDTEKALIRGGNRVFAISSLRDRARAAGGYLPLKEAKDICDAYKATL